MVDDVDQTSLTYSDQEIQDFCDSSSRRVEVNPPYQLRPVASFRPGGQTAWRYFHAPVGNWEDNVELYDQSWNLIDSTTYTAELITGKWTFFGNTIDVNGNTQYGHYPPVYIHAYYYDLFAIAADILENWAAKVKLEISFGAGGSGDKFHANQKMTNLEDVARLYRRQQRAIAAPFLRNDINV